jgi:Tfp pilus assembly protein PilF
VHLSLANALQDQGRLDEAIVHFRRAVALDPEGADARNNLGAALASKGLVDEAVTQFRRALDIRPGYADAERNLGQALQLQRARGSRR